ncbi:MAG: HAD superfamily hydrolase (TIGR01549 family) [Saprospiraceae bacterium]|jgi:HAD superfamily hydrolase (TIGR01549 family)
MIKNIIFDFGGVLLNLDQELTFSELSEVTGIPMTSEDIPAHIFKVLLGYEKGEINTETFLWHLQKESTTLIPQPDRLIKAWNAMLLGWDPGKFDFLLELRKDYKVFLLSNTNELHIEWVLRDLKKNHNITDFDTRFFDRTFYSHKMKMRKPEEQIYRTVIEETGVNASETLFIDDNKNNVSAAISAGWKAILHDAKTDIIDQLPTYLRSI